MLFRSSLAKATCTKRTFARPGASPGAFVAWAMADSTCAVAESSELNNASSASYLVAKPTPDAGPPDVSLPDTSPPADLPPPPDSKVCGPCADAATCADAKACPPC